MDAKRRKLNDSRSSTVDQSCESRADVEFAHSESTERLLANADVWPHIFALLGVEDRIRVETASKRLRSLMFDCWKRERCFDIVSLACAIHYFDPSKCEAAVVAICVARIGAALRCLQLGEGTGFGMNRSSDAAFRSIGQGCPNVETIDLHICGVDVPLALHFDTFTALKCLKLSSPNVRFGGFVEAPLSVFLSIPPSIESICGLALSRTDSPLFANERQLEAFFAERPSLKEIRLRRLRTQDRSPTYILNVIAEQCPQLKCIDLALCRIGGNGICKLVNVRELRCSNYVAFDFELQCFCEQNPLVEVLEISRLEGADISAVGSLTKLRELSISCAGRRAVKADAAAKFARDLASNSGASLWRIHLPPWTLFLPTAAIEAFANGCTTLRRIKFSVRTDEATPASIRLLIDSVVADPSWTPTDELKIDVTVHGDAALMAAFQALAAPAARLPSRVTLKIATFRFTF